MCGECRKKMGESGRWNWRPGRGGSDCIDSLFIDHADLDSIEGRGCDDSSQLDGLISCEQRDEILLR